MKNNVIQKITILIFILFIGIFSLWNVITPTKEYSENENRTLSSLPETNIHTVFTGNYDDLFVGYCLVILDCIKLNISNDKKKI